METGKFLPLGTCDFDVLRSSNEIYVDKTALIYQLAGQGRGKIFLSRPRRFGKSLLVSTFESLFSHGLRDFRGLAIEKLWRDREYRVVRLDFSKLTRTDDAEKFRQSLYDYLQIVFAPLGFRLQAPGSSFLLQLDRWLGEQELGSLVFLIDEYDAPLVRHLDSLPKFCAVRDTLSDFFAILKGNDRCQRFLFITGVTKLSSTSIFSAFNNLRDISLMPEYGALLGYTEPEIRSSFAPFLQKAGEELGLGEEELLQALRLHYDGYCFDEAASAHVFCPWSVLNFLASPKDGFQNYWFQSGGQPAVLTKYLEGHDLASPASAGLPRAVWLGDLKSPSQYEDIKLEVLLTQAGYLTIKSVSDGGAFLGFPNREVEDSMYRLYAERLLRGKRLMKPDEKKVAALFAEGSVDDVVSLFNRIFNAISYFINEINDEASCQSHLQAVLLGASLLARSESPTALGRSDLEILTGRRRWVFELKYARPGDQPEQLLNQALEQVRSRHYGETDLDPSVELIRVGLVFSSEEKRFVVWRQAD